MQPLLDPALWVGIALGWIVFHYGQRIRAIRRKRMQPYAEAEAPRGIDYADVRTGLYQHGVPADTPLHAALALSALDCEREGFYHDRLDLLPPEAPQATRFLARFAARHRITGPAEWATQLNELRHGGHRRQIAAMRELVARLLGQRDALGHATDPDALNDWLRELAFTYGPLHALRERQFRGLLEHPERWQRMHGLAYDLSRMVLYYRAGVRRGYIDQAQAIEQIERLAQTAASAYTDWSSFEKDLLCTAAFVEDDAASIVVAAQRLRDDPASPWKVLSWPSVATAYAQD